MRRLRWCIAFSVALFAAGTVSAFAADQSDSECVWPAPPAVDAQTIADACSVQLSARPDNATRADLLMKRGRAFKWMHRLDDAAADLDEAIRLAPNDPVMRLWRGWIAYDTGNYQYASALANQALAIRAEYSNAFDLLGTIAVQTGNLRDARESYNRAVAADPDNLHAHDNLLRLYRRVGAQQEQLRELDAILALKLPELDEKTETIHRRLVPWRVYLRIERAELLKRMGRTQDAAKAYDEFVRDDPGAMSYGVRANFLSYTMNDETRALADLDEAIKADDQFSYLHSEKGLILSTLKRYDEAEASFTRALILDHADGTALWGRARARRALDRLKPSIADAQMALIVDGRFLRFKAKSLIERGYLPELADDKDALEAVKDAAQACMIDKECW